MITLLAVVSCLFLFVENAYNNLGAPAAGYSNAPGEQSCGTVSCHNGSPLNSPAFSIGAAGGWPTSYTINQTYNLYTTLSFSAAVRGFQVTAVNAAGNKMGDFTLSNPNLTALTTGVNGRQYVSHDTASGAGAWTFRWTAPPIYSGKVYFYACAVGGNNDGTAAGDVTYCLVDSIPGALPSGGVLADFTASSDTVCIGQTVTFTNTSQGAVTSYDWDFGVDATPGTASTVGPHAVTYSSVGNKTVSLEVSDGTNTDDVSKTITVIAGITAYAGMDDTICAGDTITLTASGGSDYAWSNGGTSASTNVYPTVTTDYIVTVTSGGCSGTDTVTVVVNQAPNMTTSNDTSVCVGGVVTLRAFGVDEYLWSGGISTDSVVSAPAPPAGVYGILVAGTDTSTGCVDVDTIIVTSVAAPIVNIPDTNACSGSSVVLDAGNAGSTYLWSTAETTQTITVTTAGTYSVTVTNATGCSATDTAAVSFAGSLTVTLPDTTVCNGNPVTLDAGVTGASYLWSTTETTQTITVTNTGSYSVTVTLGGCTGIDIATVSATMLPPVEAGDAQTICQGETAFLGDVDSVGGFVPVVAETFNACSQPTGWTTTGVSGPNGWSFGTDSDRTTSSMNGSCFAFFNDDALPISQDGNLATLTSPSVDMTPYGGAALIVDYIFRDATGTPMPDYFKIEVYDGTAYQEVRNYTSSAGTGNEYDDFIRDTIDISPYLNSALQVRFSYYDGNDWTWYAGIDNFVILGVPNGLYSWSPTTGITSPNSPVTMASPSSTTWYYLTVSDGAGCTKTDSVLITVNPSPVVSFTGLGASYCADDASDYTLAGTPAGGTFSGPGITGDDFVPADAGAGTHSIIYSYFDTGLGCTGRDTQTVVVNPIPQALITNVPIELCLNDAPITVNAIPAGGTLSGTGISGGTFDPATAGGGVHTLTYTYTDPTTSCADTFEMDVAVIDVALSFTGLGTGYCAAIDERDTLVGNVAGGMFSGPGIVDDSVFSSLAAGAGTHTITYSYDTNLYYSVSPYLVFDTIPTPPTATTVTFSSTDESVSSIIPIGFSFNFFGNSYTDFIVSTNGWISFDVSLTGSDLSNDEFPDPSATDNVIAYMWDDLETDEFTYFTTGTAPNRQFVINFYNSYHYGDDEPVKAQIVLHETTGIVDITCVECSKDASGTSATQGLENVDGTAAAFIADRNDDDWDAFNETVRFMPVGTCTFTTTQTVTVDGVYAAFTDTTICEGETITLQAIGGASYLWSTGETTATITVSPNDSTDYWVSGTSAGGCSSSDTITVNVAPLPTPVIGGLATTYCSNDSAVTLNLSPAGGTLTGTGISGNDFDPMAAGPGTYDIKYEVSNSFGCVDSVVVAVEVINAPSASFTNLDTAYCLDALPVTLAATPAGGTFSGPGVSNGTFVPYYAGVGTHTIVYRVSFGTGCDAVVSMDVTVNDVPTVSYNALNATYCVNADTVDLIGSPAGGTFSGPGVSGNQFIPVDAGVGGPYVIFYEYADSNSCASLTAQITEVTDLPTLNFVGLNDTYCENDAFVTLVANPAGGTFSGTGVNANGFYPANAGVGTFDITYTYSSGGCTNTLTKTVTVNAAPTASIDNLDTSYCVNEGLIFLEGTPSGGVFSGPGVTGDVFSQSSVGSGGPYAISYTYTDTNGCATTAQQDVTIYPYANTVITGLDSVYCVTDATLIPVNGFPAGGTLTGAGVIDGSFKPYAAGLGVHELVYAYENTYGCLSWASFTVTVDACVGVDEVNALGDISIYPNPTNGLVYVSFNGISADEVSLEIYNVQGQKLYQEQLTQVTSTTTKQLDMSSYSEGVYLIKLESAGQTFIGRVVLQ